MTTNQPPIKTEASIVRETVAMSEITDAVWDDVAPESASLLVETAHAIQDDPVHFHHPFKQPA